MSSGSPSALVGVIACASLLSACGAHGDVGGAISAGGGVPPSGESTGSSSGGEAASASTEPTTQSPKLDLDGSRDSGSPPTACQAIDFLFVIDDSGSMEPYQANLIASFPGFIDGISQTLDTVHSLRVAVTTCDAYVFNVPECMWLGSSVVRTGGDFSSQATCGPYAAGKNYMTEADDLAEAFSCAAQVGTGGDEIERPMGAVVNAMRPADPGTAPCNGDFVRDEALLVVVVLTDEYDGPDDPKGDGSLGDPESWRAAVIEAKGGLASNVAVVVITNYAGGPCEPGDVFHDGVHMVTFAQSFGENGFVAGICEEDYSIPLAQAIEVILGACQDFVPPG